MGSETGLQRVDYGNRLKGPAPVVIPDALGTWGFGVRGAGATAAMVWAWQSAGERGLGWGLAAAVALALYAGGIALRRPPSRGWQAPMVPVEVALIAAATAAAVAGAAATAARGEPDGAPVLQVFLQGYLFYLPVVAGTGLVFGLPMALGAAGLSTAAHGAVALLRGAGDLAAAGPIGVAAGPAVALAIACAAGLAGDAVPRAVAALEAERRESRRRADLARAIHRISQRVVDGAEMEQVLQVVTESAARLLDAESAVVLLDERAMGGVAAGVHIGGWYGRRPARVPALTRLPEPDREMLARLTGGDDGSTCRDWRLDGAAEPVRSLLVRLGQDRVLLAGLQTGGERTGWLAVGIDPARQTDRLDVQVLLQLAEQAAVAVAHALQASRSEAREKRLAILYEIGRSMASSLRPEALYETIYQEVARILKTDAFFIALYSHEEETVQLLYLVDEGVRYPPTAIRAKEGPTMQVIHTGKPVLMNRPAEEATGARHLGSGKEPASLLIVPMIREGRVVGAVSVQTYRPGGYTQEDLELLQTIASQAVIFIENARLYERTQEMSLTDFLTGLGNARLFHQTLEKEIARARRTGQSLSIVMIDSDSLKYVNDRFGHPAGDRHLIDLSTVIKNNVRLSDTVVRYAGDEFSVILPDATKREAEAVAARICAQVGASTLRVAGGHEVSTTVSIGVATFPEDGERAEELFRAADEAMYRAKRSGKNRVCLAGRPD